MCIVVIISAADIAVFFSDFILADAMQRVYCIGKPAKATKAALLLSSGSPGVYDGAIATYKAMTSYTGLQDMGIVTAAGEENGSEAKMAEIAALAKSL